MDAQAVIAKRWKHYHEIGALEVMTFTASVPLTWTCHVCKDVRPDAQINVMSRWAYRLGQGRSVSTSKESRVYFKQNVRYCRDRGSCIAEAANKSFFDSTIFVDESEVPDRWKGQA